MKIVCIGRNYGAHALELGNAIPKEPVFFMKPETAVLDHRAPFQIPSWSREIHYEVELLFRIHRVCRNENVTQLSKFVDRYNLGLDLTARDVQDRLKKQGLPWEKAKAFDGSAVIGDCWMELPADPDKIQFRLERNGSIVQQGVASDMLFPPAELLTHLSRYMTLEPGDIIFTGTPAGVGPLAPGDELVGFLDGVRHLELKVEGTTPEGGV
jgi:acylpyruvate hydrolase